MNSPHHAITWRGSSLSWEVGSWPKFKGHIAGGYAEVAPDGTLWKAEIKILGSHKNSATGETPIAALDNALGAWKRAIALVEAGKAP